MPRPKFKTKCKICRTNWVVLVGRQFPMCVDCHMKKIFSQEVTEEKFQFLNIDRSLYEKSRFLRNIRQAYLMYEDLTERQIEAFKETVEKLKNPPKEEAEEKEAVKTKTSESPGKKRAKTKKKKTISPLYAE